MELFAVQFLFTQKIGEDYSRISMFLMGILYLGIGYITRIIWKWIVKKTRRQVVRSLLVLCSPENAAKTIYSIQETNSLQPGADGRGLPRYGDRRSGRLPDL